VKHLLIAVIGTAFLFAEAWAFMILVGVIHGEWLPMVPTISYVSAVKVSLTTTVLTAIVGLSYGISKELMGDE
jgi:hypothetical protein